MTAIRRETRPLYRTLGMICQNRVKWSAHCVQMSVIGRPK